MTARWAQLIELPNGIELAIVCAGCGARLGEVHKPEYVPPANAVGSGKHITLDPRYAEKPRHFYIADDRPPRRAHSERNSEPDVIADPATLAVMEMVLRRNIVKPSTTFVPYDSCRVKCYSCGETNEVNRPR